MNLIDLTQREREILRLLAHGLSDGEIANALVLTVGTVKWYNRQIYSKLGVNNRTLAVTEAQRLGLLDDPSVTAPVQPKHNLPAQITSFIGRTHELAELKRLLQVSRLITLTGTPGTGKTRLSLQAAAEVHNLFRDGVFFVSLAPLHDPDLVVNAIAQTLDLAEVSSERVMNILKRHLHDRQLLLVLDNFEHLLPAAPVVSELLGSASQLVVLVTSRELLNLYGEVEFVVPPLQLPDLTQPFSIESLYPYETIQLFVERAHTALPTFELTPENVASVATICVHLDGLPLAIELAAARSKIYPPQSLLIRLGSRLQTLTHGPRDLPARQQTLRSTLEWSYDLLDSDEKNLFARLGVFRGGWTLESAAAICSDGLHTEIADGMESLLTKSLLRQENKSGGEVRFTMLETMREYALEKLAESGEQVTIRTRHAQHFLEMAEQATQEYFGSNEIMWFVRLEAEHDNLRTAIQWWLMTENVLMSLRLTASMSRFWEIRGYLSEGRVWLTQALSKAGNEERTIACANAYQGAGDLAYLQSDYDATRMFYEHALSIYQELGDQRGTAHTQVGLGETATEIGDYVAALILFQEAFSIMQHLEDTHGYARALTQLGWSALRVGDYTRARECLEEGLTLFEADHNNFSVALTYSGLGEIAIRVGQYETAVDLLEKSLNLRDELGDRWGIAASLGSLAWVELLQGDFEFTVEKLRLSLNIRRDIGDKGGIVWCLEKLAEIAVLTRQPARAATVFGATAAFRKSMNSIVDPADQPHYTQLLHRLETTLGSIRFQELWDEGQVMTLEQTLEYALDFPPGS